jgi:hypothetical protein
MGALSSANLLGNKIPVEQAHELVAVMQSKEKLTTLCGFSREEAMLDVSNQGLGPGDAVLITNDISDMRALSSANLLGNSIPVEQAQELVKIMRAKENLTTLCGLSRREETELDFSGQNLGAGDAVLIANDICDMGALTKFDISGNPMDAEGCKIIVEALRGNNTLTELNIAKCDMAWGGSKHDDMSAVVALSAILPEMGALTSLDISGNSIGICDDLPEGWTHDSGYRDCYRHKDGNQSSPPSGAKSSGAIAIVSAISDMRALSKLNVRGNNISTSEKARLQSACDANGVSLSNGVSPSSVSRMRRK